MEKYESQILIRLPEELDEEPDKAVAEEVESHPDSILELHFPEHKPHKDTEEKPLEEGLVQLARMPWLILPREYHTYRGIRDTSV